MRKTYRTSTVKDYWNKRWSAIPADEAMVNIKKYPLSSAYKALSRAKNCNTAPLILEAGCGNGRLLRHFHGRGYEIIGVDFIKTAIKKIRSVDPELQVEFGDVKSLRFADATFSHIFAFGLYHNFEEEGIKLTLAETSRVLQKGGILCASFRADNIQNLINDTFFSRNLGAPAKKSKLLSDIDEQFHKINLKKKEVIEFLEECGFTILDYEQIDNMPLLYKLSMLRTKSHREFNEQTGRKQGYLMNWLGRSITAILKVCFPSQFFNLHVVICQKK